MFRVNKKSLSGVLFVIAMSAAACNNVSGPTSRVAGDPIDRNPREPAVYDKVCVEELRAVAITSPSESRLLHVDDFVVITWEAQHVCGAFTARAEVSYNDGLYYEVIGERKNGLSMSWRVGGNEGDRVKIRVTLIDGIGNVSEELGLASVVQGRRDEPGHDDPDQHD
jgi:hypothetical protein